MTKALRKKHLQIWTVFAVLLPVGIISAYMAVPEKTTGRLLQTSSAQALPVVIKTVDKTNYTASLRTNSGSSQLQLEWRNKVASVYPSSLIYQLAANSNDIKDAGIVGRVEAGGDYYFALKKDTGNNYKFVLYDIIHQQKIDSINF
jgi:ABC-type phosphate/phosphonate transport system permease subunit